MQPNGFLKLVYTWDYRMRWAPVPRPVERGMGGRPYPYGEDIFIEDYSRAFDWLARHGYDGVIIWGLLRDSHGGVKAAGELCRRARESGIRVIAGVGVNCYGGVFWEGNHPYNLQTWIQKHPELAATGPDGKPFIRNSQNDGGSMLCPSRPENAGWNRQALRFLIEEVSPGGILYETGDYGKCSCSSCKGRLGHASEYSYADIGTILPPLLNTVHDSCPALIQLVCLYGTIPYYRSLGLDLVERHVPEYAWCSWIFEGGVGWASTTERSPWRTVVCAPIPDFQAVTGRDLAFVQYNCFAGFDEGLMAPERIRTTAQLCRERGLRGMIQMGELSEASNLVNYLALPYFLQHPRANLAEFLDSALPEIRGQSSRGPSAAQTP